MTPIATKRNPPPSDSGLSQEGPQPPPCLSSDALAPTQGAPCHLGPRPPSVSPPPFSLEPEPFPVSRPPQLPPLGPLPGFPGSPSPLHPSCPGYSRITRRRIRSLPVTAGHPLSGTPAALPSPQGPNPHTSVASQCPRPERLDVPRELRSHPLRSGPSLPCRRELRGREPRHSPTSTVSANSPPPPPPPRPPPRRDPARSPGPLPLASASGAPSWSFRPATAPNLRPALQALTCRCPRLTLAPLPLPRPPAAT
ncbi:PREDICTED: vegetative cell wall protein gp1-like [Ceratotherium simum simum]|uniref:Vegetative cell wall protein gp1-like n=1 Tax=Ceratotherium simum simum TaxID=73337 RepID=A0ABM1CJJ8_CERSS|nr:PREDICTED: vegetative cell wall protein gp1-like [Ceratotherium simum simum]